MVVGRLPKNQFLVLYQVFIWDSVKTVQDALKQLYGYVVDIEMKASDECGLM